MKKIKEHISIIIIVAILLLGTFFVGSPMYEGKVKYLYIIIGVFSFLYYIFKREKMVKDRIDIWMVILFFSTLIPLIFKTYVSISEVVLLATRYICILNIFLITKHECQKNPKYVDVILNTIIISILILCIIGLDELGGNCLKDFKKIIGYKDIGLKESRVGSLFSYANTMAAVAGMGVFLCIGYIIKSKNILVKLIYIVIGILMFVTMILTYSRLVFIVFAFICFLYAIVLLKKYKINLKINKKIILYLTITLVLGIIYIIVGLQIKDELIVNSKYQKRLYNIKPDTDYNFTFDIYNEEVSQKNNFIIKIVEKDEYMDTIKTTKVNVKNFNGKKEINIHTKEETVAIYLNINNNKQKVPVKIQSLYINGEEEVLKYKMLPSKLVFKLQGISLNQKSAWQRFVFIKDAFKQIKNNWLFGLGANAWRSVQLESQEYKYYAKEVHSYPTQIFLENGIIGFIACIGILCCIVKMFYIEFKREQIDILKISQIISVLFVFLHSIFDFNMSFFYVLLIVFSILSSLTIEDKSNNKKNVFSIIFLLILICFSGTIVYTNSIQIRFNKNKEMLKITEKWTEERIFSTYQKLIPYNLGVKLKNYNVSKRKKDYNSAQKILENIIKTEKYYNSNLNLDYIYDYIKYSLKSKGELENNINLALEYIYNTEDFNKFTPSFQINRLNNLKKIVNILYNNNEIEYAEQFNRQLIKEINKKEKDILDYEKGRYSKSKVKKYKEKLDELLDKYEKMEK